MRPFCKFLSMDQDELGERCEVFEHKTYEVEKELVVLWENVDSLSYFQEEADRYG